MQLARRRPPIELEQRELPTSNGLNEAACRATKGFSCVRSFLLREEDRQREPFTLCCYKRNRLLQKENEEFTRRLVSDIVKCFLRS